MLLAFAILLVAQLLGEAIVRVLELPLPGPVVGMIILFGLVLARIRFPAEIGDTADGMLKHLSLLFVPAGVGVVQHLERLGADGLQLIAVVMLTTVITLTVTALVFELVARPLQVDQRSPDGEGGRHDQSRRPLGLPIWPATALAHSDARPLYRSRCHLSAL
jgi:putative effector of murein hydrolase LrgA (UPF0299 family)